MFYLKNEIKMAGKIHKRITKKPKNIKKTEEFTNVILKFGRFQLELEPNTSLTAWKKSGQIELEEIVIDESDEEYHTEDHEAWCSF